jgi:hypothetical protein
MWWLWMYQVAALIVNNAIVARYRRLILVGRNVIASAGRVVVTLFVELVKLSLYVRLQMGK